VTEALKATASTSRPGVCHPRFNLSAQAGRDSRPARLVDVAAAVQYALDKF
jgi:hypothetical protein